MAPPSARCENVKNLSTRKYFPSNCLLIVFLLFVIQNSFSSSQLMQNPSFASQLMQNSTFTKSTDAKLRDRKKFEIVAGKLRELMDRIFNLIMLFLL